MIYLTLRGFDDVLVTSSLKMTSGFDDVLGTSSTKVSEKDLLTFHIACHCQNDVISVVSC